MSQNNKLSERTSAQKSILNIYEDKLYNKAIPLWKNWLEVKPAAARLPRKKTTIRFTDQKENESLPQVYSTVSRTKIREIKCFSCSCIDSVEFVEKTEDLLETLRDCSYACGACMLNTLPHFKKKHKHFLESANFKLDNDAKLLLDKKDYLEAVFRQPNSSFGLRTDSLKPFYPSSLDQKLLSLEKRFDIDNNNSNTACPPSVVPDPDNSDATEPCQDLEDVVFLNNTNCAVTKEEKPALTVAKQKAFDNSDLLAYSYHRQLIAQGKMKHQAGKKPVRVHLLTGESILLVFDPKVYVKEVFEQICAMHSIKETHFFGLSALVENEHRFLDLKQRMAKYAPKEWGKELRRRASDFSVQPSSVFTVQFQVQYYVEHPKLICNPSSRHHYYLQLKKNVLQSKVPVQDELIFTLAATALHLDLGPFDPSTHKGQYFDPNDYVPAWFLRKWDENYLWSHLPTMHEELITTSNFQSLADYIKQASTIDDVPVHYYRLFKTKKESEPSVVMGIFNEGVRIHHMAKQRLNAPHLLDFEFPWSKVGRLFFAGKRFEIYPDDLPSSRKLVYYTGSRSRSKYLLRLLRDTHSLFMSLSPFVEHMRKVDVKSGKQRKYRESYISGMNLEEKVVEMGERLVGSDEKCSDKTQKDRSEYLIAYGSATSDGSSRTSGVESDGKTRSEDFAGDDNAFVEETDHPVLLDSAPSGESAQEKIDINPMKRKDSGETSGSQTIENVEVHHRLRASQKSLSAAVGSSSKVERKNSVSSDNKVLLDTRWMQSKTATLKKNLSEDSGVAVCSEAFPLADATGSKPEDPDFKLPPEDTIVTLLHQSRIDPMELESHSCGPPGTCLGSTKPKKNDKPSVTERKKKTRSKELQDPGLVQRAYSNDSGLQKNTVALSKFNRMDSTSSRHRRNKSVHDASPADTDDPSGKHFGAPLSQKKSVEDLTGLEQIPIEYVPADQLLHHSLNAHGHDSDAFFYSGSNGPIIGVKFHQANGTIPRAAPENRNNRRRSDLTDLTTNGKLNGFAVGAAGSTPGKPEMLLRKHRDRTHPVSYCHVFSDSDYPPTQINGSCTTSAQTPHHHSSRMDNFKEVIV